MQLILDNLKGLGPLDYSAYIDAEHLPTVTRRLNKVSTMQVQLVAGSAAMVVPAQGARVLLQKNDGTVLFGGFLIQQPAYEYVGRGAGQDIARYTLECASDEWLLDHKALPQRSPCVARTAGAVLGQLTQDIAFVPFDITGISACDVLPVYSVDTQRTWSLHAAEIGTRARAAYRAENQAITLTPIGTTTIKLDETVATFDRSALKLRGSEGARNAVTIVGHAEPRTFVKDYFEGDGYTLTFALAERPIDIFNRTVMEDTFPGTSLNPVLWSTPSGPAVLVNNGVLTLAGSALVEFVEQVEMGGGLELQHGCCEFQAGTGAILGGLYAGGLANGNCVAGFSVQASGAQSTIQALVNGGLVGPAITTTAGHQYQLTTRIFADQLYRSSQVFHSSLHGAGLPIGGEPIPSDARVVLEVHDVDPSNPATIAAPSTVLWDGIYSSLPAFCTYALVNGNTLHCSLSLTRMIKNGGAVVRSAISGQPFRTLLQGSLVEGSECRLSSTSLTFLSAYVPEAAEQIVVIYRTSRTATSEVQYAGAANPLKNAVDDGIRSSVHGMQVPEARTTEDCMNAGLALLDDGAQTAWSGEYTTWSDFLGASDAHPGDGVAVNSPSRNANFGAILREVRIEVKDLANDRSTYKLRFANESAEPIAYSVDKAHLRLPPVGVVVPANWTLAPVKDAQFSQILDSQVTIATNLASPIGGGFEVRGNDVGWGASNDRSLLGRFTAQSFTVPRLSRSQCYFIRQYDNAQPPNYSRDATLLHVDWPL